MYVVGARIFLLGRTIDSLRNLHLRGLNEVARNTGVKRIGRQNFQGTATIRPRHIRRVKLSNEMRGKRLCCLHGGEMRNVLPSRKEAIRGYRSGVPFRPSAVARQENVAGGSERRSRFSFGSQSSCAIRATTF